MRKFITILLFATILTSLRSEDLRQDTLDVKSVHLGLDFTSFSAKILRGHATLGIKSKMNAVQHINLDLLKLQVDSVKLNGTYNAFLYNDSVIHIAFPATLNMNDSATIEIFYHGTSYQAPGDFGGFYWTNLYAFNIGVSFLAVPHAYGRVWFPCFDNFVQRSDYSFEVTTNSNQTALCNGLLVNNTDNGNGSHTWYWKLNQSIPSYLASVTVSDYQSLNDTVQGIKGVLPVILAARAADTTALKNSFVNLKKAFHIYENLLGPYEFDRVGYCVVPFSAGAMEHATNISYMQALVNGNTAYETTMAHELSHHWFGDLATCDKAEEMWLNEGWAVYAEHLFLEKMYGDSTYKKVVRDNHEDVLRLAHAIDSGYHALNNVPLNFTYGRTVYNKGADVAHSLRAYTDSATFFSCLRSYLQQYAFKDVNSLKFRDYLTQCAGSAYTNAFDDMVLQPGFAHFSIEQLKDVVVNWSPDIEVAHQFIIRQRLQHANDYYSNVPVTVSYFYSNGTRLDETVIVSGPCTEHQSPIDQFTTLSYVAIDFEEKIQDAITDEWRKITTTGTYNFGTAKMSVTVNQTPTDTVLLRIEHNWVPAERMPQGIPGLFLHDYRYWSVDGINLDLLNANARLDYNGSTSTANGFLDNTFFSNSEDSLVLLYRPHAESEWMIADSFVVSKQGSAINKIGFVTLYGIQKGEYCFGIWDFDRVDTLQVESPCEFTSITHTPSLSHKFSLYPNPSDGRIYIEFEKAIFSKAEVVDLLGRTVLQTPIDNSSLSMEIDLRSIEKGSYLVVLRTPTGQSSTRKLIRM